MTVSLSLLPLMAAITFIIPHYYHITLQLPDINDTILLMLHWHLFSWRGREDIRCCIAWNHSVYVAYELLPQSNTLIPQDSKTKIIDTWLILIFTMGHWLYRLLCWQYTKALPRLCLSVTKSLYHFLTYKTKNCWRSTNTHCIVLSRQSLLQSIIVWITIWTNWLPLCQIET
jgi:hypothetical protein